MLPLASLVIFTVPPVLAAVKPPPRLRIPSPVNLTKPVHPALRKIMSPVTVTVPEVIITILFRLFEYPAPDVPISRVPVVRVPAPTLIMFLAEVVPGD